VWRSVHLASDLEDLAHNWLVRSASKEVVGIHLLQTHSLFGHDILRRLLLRAPLVKSLSAALRF